MKKERNKVQEVEKMEGKRAHLKVNSANIFFGMAS